MTRSKRRIALIAAGMLSCCGVALASGTRPIAHAALAGIESTRARLPSRVLIPLRPCDRSRTSVPGDLSALVMDLQGRSLKFVPSRAMAVVKGALVFLWDGKTEEGAFVAPGVYRVRVASSSLSLRAERLLVLR